MMPHLETRRKVTNLADGVTDDDIKELFESVGPVKFAAIEWDRRCVASTRVQSEPRACLHSVRGNKTLSPHRCLHLMHAGSAVYVPKC